MGITRLSADKPTITRGVGGTAAITPVAGSLAVPATTDAATAALVDNPGSATAAAVADAIAADPTVTSKADEIEGGRGLPRVVNRSDYATLALALTAAGSGGTVHYDDGNYNEAATTISNPVTLDGDRVTIFKTANGAILTITASNVRISKGITLNGQSGTYTGPNITITGNGTTTDLVFDCSSIQSDQWGADFGIGAGQRAVIGAGLWSTTNKTASDAAMTSGSAVLTSATAAFTAADVGKYALVRGALSATQTTWYHVSKIVTYTSATSVTLADVASRTVSGELLEVHYPAFRFGAEYGAGVTGDRHMIGTHTGGYLLADLGGIQTIDMTATNSRGLIFSSSSCAKVSASGSNRFATSGGTTFVQGVNHSFVGATFAGDVVLMTTSSSSVVRGNVSGTVYDYGVANDAQGQMLSFPPHSVDPRMLSAATALVTNQAVYMRVRGRGYISKIALHVAVQSGNICVGVYANGTGAGTLAAPAVRKATSGSVACPAAGVNEIALTAAVYVEEGDWLAIAADNNTATFYRANTAGFSSSLNKGFVNHQNTAYPLPNPAVPSNGAIFSTLLVGVA